MMALMPALRASMYIVTAFSRPSAMALTAALAAETALSMKLLSAAARPGKTEPISAVTWLLSQSPNADSASHTHSRALSMILHARALTSSRILLTASLTAVSTLSTASATALMASQTTSHALSHQ